MARGRPKKEIDQGQFEKLCALQCTMLEICSFFDVSDKTLQAWCKRTYKMNFSEIFNIKKQIGKISLRRSQMKLAEKSAHMAIYLGEKWLKDSEETENTENDDFIKALDNKASEVWEDAKQQE